MSDSSRSSLTPVEWAAIVAIVKAHRKGGGDGANDGNGTDAQG